MGEKKVTINEEPSVIQEQEEPIKTEPMYRLSSHAKAERNA